MLCGSLKFKVNNINIDSLLLGLNQQLDASKHINSRFGVLIKLNFNDALVTFKMSKIFSDLCLQDLDKTFAEDLPQLKAFRAEQREIILLQIKSRNELQAAFRGVY